MMIKNSRELGRTPLRRSALLIAEAGLFSLDISAALKKEIYFSGDAVSVSGRSFKLKKNGRLIFVGVGKCSAKAALAIEKILGDRLSDGIAADVSFPIPPKRIKFYKGDHPFPTERNVFLTSKILELLTSLTEDDFVIFLISGGGTVLLCQPQSHTYIEERAIVEDLFRASANILDMNIVRKHLSLARGGFLAKAAYPARSVALIISDVPGNDIGTVSSGPTVQDTTSVADALAVVQKYGFTGSPNFNPKFFIETPKEDRYFERIENILFMSNQTALLAMKEEAGRQGFKTEIMTAVLEGEAREVGARIAEGLKRKPPKSAALFGGETTVTIRKEGRGGRNQELALSALQKITDNSLIMAIASDGVDNTEAAGAICDKLVFDKALELKMSPNEFLDNNDSFSFFEKTGGLIMTGRTGVNVSDLVIAIKE